MALLMASNGHWQKHWFARIGLFAETYLAFLNFFNLPRRAKRNVAHHYDLKDSLFDHFLNPRCQYSCSYSHTAHDTQQAQKDQRQKHLAFHLCDYRHQRGSFNRIVSASMLEHAGMRHFDSYFASVARLLAPNGAAMVYAIEVHHNTKRCNRWLNKHISLGAISPRLNKWRVRRGIEG